MAKWLPPIPAERLYSAPALTLGPALAMLLWCYDGVEKDGTVKIEVEKVAETMGKPYRTIKDWWKALRTGPFFSAIEDHGRKGFVAHFADDWLEWRIMANNYPDLVKDASSPGDGQEIALDNVQGPLKARSRTDEGRNTALDAPAYKVLHNDQKPGVAAGAQDAPLPPKKARVRKPKEEAEDTTPPVIREALARECGADSRRMIVRVNVAAKEIWARQQARGFTAEQTATGVPMVAAFCRRRVHPFNADPPQPITPEAINDRWLQAAEDMASRRRANGANGTHAPAASALASLSPADVASGDEVARAFRAARGGR